MSISRFWISQLNFPTCQRVRKRQEFLLWPDKLKTAMFALNKVYISYESLFLKRVGRLFQGREIPLERDSWDFSVAYVLGTVISVPRFSRKLNKVYFHATPENQKENIYILKLNNSFRLSQVESTALANATLLGII